MPYEIQGEHRDTGPPPERNGHIRTTFVTYEDLSKGQFAYTIDGSAHEFKDVVEGNAIIQDDIVKTIRHVLHVLKLKYNLFLVNN